MRGMTLDNLQTALVVVALGFPSCLAASCLTRMCCTVCRHAKRSSSCLALSTHCWHISGGSLSPSPACGALRLCAAGSCLTGWMGRSLKLTQRQLLLMSTSKQQLPLPSIGCLAGIVLCRWVLISAM